MRVLIADDHPLVLHALRRFLASDPEVVVVGQASNGDEALELARRLEWDIAIIDYSIPGRSGLDLLKDVKHEFPERPVLVLSVHPGEVHSVRALKVEATGHIIKDSAPQETTTTGSKVANDDEAVSPSLASMLMGAVSTKSPRPLHEKLSDREYRVMCLLASGKHVNDIAETMEVSPSTVSTYRTRILMKLKLSSNAELIRYAIRHRLIK